MPSAIDFARFTSLLRLYLLLYHVHVEWGDGFHQHLLVHSILIGGAAWRVQRVQPLSHLRISPSGVGQKQQLERNSLSRKQFDHVDIQAAKHRGNERVVLAKSALPDEFTVFEDKYFDILTFWVGQPIFAHPMLLV